MQYSFTEETPRKRCLRGVLICISAHVDVRHGVDGGGVAGKHMVGKGVDHIK